jgi:hypothetical protein
MNIRFIASLKTVVVTGFQRMQALYAKKLPCSSDMTHVAYIQAYVWENFSSEMQLVIPRSQSTSFWGLCVAVHMRVILGTENRFRFFQTQRCRDGIRFATRCEARKPLAVTYKGIVATFGQRSRMDFTFVVPCIIIYMHIKSATRCNTSILVLLQDHSTCFECFPHPSSGVQ